jgi:hypothetical protein
MDSLRPTSYSALQTTQAQRLSDVLKVTPLSALEFFHPQVVKRIELIWGTPEMGTFFERLTMDPRFLDVTLYGGELEEISMLTAVHQQLMGQRNAEGLNDFSR